MKRRLALFMTKEDEAKFSEMLIASIPGVAFIDNDIWPSPQPPLCTSIDQCSSRYVYLWNPSLMAQLPCLPRDDGGYDGPASGPVVQFERSFFRDSMNVLLSGRLAHGLDQGAPNFKPLERFSNTIWKIAKKYCGKNKLVAVDADTLGIINSNVTGYVIGPEAVAWCVADNKRLFRDRATVVYYRPIASQ